ncbi:MAG: hypothetical protein JWO90_1689 [Solirubrobacterales bacterium]|jgi:hypothetical protein|nr:hypothetical protein [Solirubrobacterales bacterium]
MTEHPQPDTPHDDPDLEAALAGPGFDDAAPVDIPDDPARPEDIAHEPGAPHLSLDEEQLEEPQDS